MIRRLVSLTAVVAAAVAVAAPAASAAGATLDGKRLAAQVVAVAAPSYPELAVTKATCPKRIKVKSGRVTTCTVDAGGVPVRYTVTQTNKKGAVTIASAQAVIGKAAAEQFVRDNTTLPAQVTPDCGPAPVIAKTPGETFVCTAVLADGSTKQVTISVTDLAGAVTVVQVASAP